MVRICLWCLPLLLTAGAANAQLFSSKVIQNDTGKIYLRFSPFGLLDLLDENFTVGGEYRFNNTWSATMDAGFIFNSQYMNHCDRATGVLLRPGIRKYAGKKKDYFFDLQFHYKDIMYHMNDWIQRDIVGGVSTYEQLAKFRYRKQVYGIHLTAGGKEFFTKDHRLFMEVTAGFGLHFKKIGTWHEGNSRYEDPYSLSANDNAFRVNTVVPALPVSIKLVYRLK